MSINKIPEKYLVSIVIPVHNGKSFLVDSLNSVLEQTHKNLEIIIVNDGSTDGSLNIINEIAEKDNRVKVINISERIGAGAARNTGIKHIRGDFSIFLDADDYYDSSMIEMMLNKMIQYNLDIVVCKCDYLIKIKNKSIRKRN